MILISFEVVVEMRQSVFHGNCTVNVNAFPQMENKIHQRKITSSTTTKQKNDGQKAHTEARTVLAVGNPMVIAPPHLKEKIVFWNVCSSLKGDRSPRTASEKSLRTNMTPGDIALHECTWLQEPCGLHGPSGPFLAPAALQPGQDVWSERATLLENLQACRCYTGNLVLAAGSEVPRHNSNGDCKSPIPVSWKIERGRGEQVYWCHLFSSAYGKG